MEEGKKIMNDIVTIPFPEYSDFALISSDGVKFPVHKVYLAKYEYFKNIFDSSEEETIKFDYTSRELSCILSEIYNVQKGMHLRTVELGNVIIFDHVYLFRFDKALVEQFVGGVSRGEFTSDEVCRIADQILAIGKFEMGYYINFTIIPKELCCVMKKEEIAKFSNYARNYFHHKELRTLLPRPTLEETEVWAKNTFISAKDRVLLGNVYGKEYINYKTINDKSRIYTDDDGVKFIINYIVSGKLADDNKTINIDDDRPINEPFDSSRLREEWDEIVLGVGSSEYFTKRKLENIINVYYTTSIILEKQIVSRLKTPKIIDIYKIVCRVPKPNIIPNPYGVEELDEVDINE